MPHFFHSAYGWPQIERERYSYLPSLAMCPDDLTFEFRWLWLDFSDTRRAWRETCWAHDTERIRWSVALSRRRFFMSPLSMPLDFSRHCDILSRSWLTDWFAFFLFRDACAVSPSSLSLSLTLSPSRRHPHCRFSLSRPSSFAGPPKCL